MFKNICNWSKCIHEPIFEIARWYHLVYIEICSMSIIRKTVWALFVVRKNNEFLRELFQKISGGSTDQDTVQKSTEFTSSVHSSILTSRKGMNCYWWNVFGPPHTAGLSWCTMPGVSVYHESSCSMSNWNRFFIRSVQFCILAAGCVCRIIGSKNWIWPS